MEITTLEGIIKNGQIYVDADLMPPEMTKVYVIVPDGERRPTIRSPRLVNKADAKLFEKTVEDYFDDEI